MLVGYKCDYCTTFLTCDAKMSKHEQSCIFNPANQQCCTCHNMTYTWCAFGPAEECTKELDWQLIENENTPCQGWQAKETNKDETFNTTA